MNIRFFIVIFIISFMVIYPQQHSSVKSLPSQQPLPSLDKSQSDINPEYEKALKAGVIDDNYIDEVLLTRRTLRRPTEVDLDRIILGLFRVSMRYRFGRFLMLLGHVPLVLRLVGTYPVRKIAYWLYFGFANQKKPDQLKLTTSQTYNVEAGGWVSR